MQIMTSEDFEAVKNASPLAERYFKGRWVYMNRVAEIVRRENPQTILEIGATDRPIALGCDNMDLADNKPFPLTYIHDATEVPWPIADNQYDMVIAMQVFEHLVGKQQQAFKEVMRVSKSAILTFPDRWHCPGDCHHNITPQIVQDWTLGVLPQEVIETSVRRVVYYWKFGKEQRQWV